MANIEERGENTYRFTVSLGIGADGKYKRKRKTYTVQQKLTPKRLEEHLDHEYLKFKQEVESGNYISPEKMTFKAFVEEWSFKFGENELSESTLKNHHLKIDNHIIPVIGHIQIDEINTMMLLDLVSNLTRKDGKPGALSNYSKNDVYQTLLSLFKYAKQWKIIKSNPMDGVNKPKNKNEEKREVNVYERDEVDLILKALQGEPPHWRIFITLAVTAGIRRGENLGLEWSNVDFENSRLDITQTIVMGKKGAIIKSPKSIRSKRLVTLPASVMDELKRFRAHWDAEKNRMGAKWTEHNREWLFCNTDGSHFYPTSPSKWWKTFATRKDIRYIRLHDIRHTSATLLIAQGVHAKIISERLGHSNIGITMNTYGHVLRTADQAAADTFESLFQPQPQDN